MKLQDDNLEEDELSGLEDEAELGGEEEDSGDVLEIEEEELTIAVSEPEARAPKAASRPAPSAKKKAAPKKAKKKAAKKAAKKAPKKAPPKKAKKAKKKAKAAKKGKKRR